MKVFNTAIVLGIIFRTDAEVGGHVLTFTNPKTTQCSIITRFEVIPNHKYEVRRDQMKCKIVLMRCAPCRWTVLVQAVLRS